MLFANKGRVSVTESTHAPEGSRTEGLCFFLCTQYFRDDPSIALECTFISGSLQKAHRILTFLRCR
jgi:hypothetical protein